MLGISEKACSDVRISNEELYAVLNFRPMAEHNQRQVVAVDL